MRARAFASTQARTAAVEGGGRTGISTRDRPIVGGRAVARRSGPSPRLHATQKSAFAWMQLNSHTLKTSCVSKCQRRLCMRRLPVSGKSATWL